MFLKIVLRSYLRQISPNGHPIGHGYPEPIGEREESAVLDHKSEAEHLASVVRDSAALKTSEEFKGLLVRRGFLSKFAYLAYTIGAIHSMYMHPRCFLFLCFVGRDGLVTTTTTAAHILSRERGDSQPPLVESRIRTNNAHIFLPPA